MSKAEPVDELTALRAQLAAARAQRETAQEALERAAEIARLKQEIADEPHITKAVEEHGAIDDRIGLVQTAMGVVIVRRPKQAVWRRFSDAGSMKGPDIHTMVKQCLVHPDAARFDSICDAYPATLEIVGGKVATLAQSRTKEAAEK